MTKKKANENKFTKEVYFPNPDKIVKLTTENKRVGMVF